ncbi:hypothetical protein HanOQP8_Chr17g0670071 [Helianthus annuus]|nr:hypothetical protein HanIR_Chr17g0885171 [Helianthus annuus]KAJ0637123.1 hypothetical protein HanOQP8_Chr17g0670071 [Helianthus annuus]
MVTALMLNKKYNFSNIVFRYMVENITSESKTWIYPRFIQMILDHAYPDLERDDKNDLLQLFHMDNEMLKVLARYYTNHPEPSTKAEFFGFIKDKNYQDPDPVDHQNWRNEKEMKEASYADELKILEIFKETRNEWFLKGEKKKRSRKAAPKVQAEVGSSSQPKKKHQKKNVETMLVDESEEEDEAEAEAEDNVEGDHLSPESDRLLKALNESFKAVKATKETGDESDDVEESSSSSSKEEIDENERAERIRAEIEKEKQLKRKRREDKDDELYNPSPEHVIESQTPPSFGGRKKTSVRKSVVSPKAARRRMIIKLNPKRSSKPKPSQPPSPPPEPSPPQSPHKSPPKQHTPPPSPPPHLSPLHQSPPHQSPIQEQLVFTSSQIFQTPPSKQPHVQTTQAGSSSLKDFPYIQ